MKNLVVFSIDDKYVDPFIVAIKSFSYYHESKNYIIGLIHSNLSKKNISKIKSFFKGLCLELDIKKIKDTFTKYKTDYHFNSVIFYRLLIPELFNTYKQSLYLDSDMIFLGNIDALFDRKSKEFTLGVVSRGDKYDVPQRMQSYTNTYFASGLLLINHHSFSKNKVFEKCIYFLENFSYEMPDQDALNYAVQDKNIHWIPNEYGVLTHQADFDKSNLNSAKILQFCGSQKPWKYGNNHPCKEMYLEIRSQTPFSSINFIVRDYIVIKLKSIKHRVMI